MLNYLSGPTRQRGNHAARPDFPTPRVPFATQYPLFWVGAGQRYLQPVLPHPPGPASLTPTTGICVMTPSVIER